MLVAPDVEQAVVAALRAAGITARSVLVPPYPGVRVLRVGGDRDTVLDRALIQIDAAVGVGESKAVCLAALERAIAALRDAEGKTVAGVVISGVAVTTAPLYAPDDRSGAPRYLATLLVSSRASVPQT